MMDTKTCTKCGEEKPLDEFPRYKNNKGKVCRKGQCRICFSASRKAKDAAYRERRRAMKPPRVTRTCEIDGCDNKYECKGLCHLHYSRLKRTGTTNPPVYGKRLCSVEGCDRKHKGHGLCILHWNRSRKAENKEIRRRSYVKHQELRREQARLFYKNLSTEEKIAARKKRQEAIANWPEERWVEARAKRNKSRECPEVRKARCAEQKEYANRPENVEKIRAYRKMYVEKLGEEYRLKRNAYSRAKAKEDSESLSNTHIKRLLGQRSGIKNPPQALIELKRVQMKIFRELKQRATK